MTLTKKALLTACLLVGGTVTHQAQVTIDVASGGAIAETGSSFTFNVSGLSADVSSVALRLALSYSFLDDLNISLTSPGGVKSVAVLGAGAAFAGTEFRDVVFSDNGSAFPSNPVADPFSGNFKTQTGQNLSSGASSFSGLTPAQANGAWILSFTDVNPVDGDTGTLYKGATAPWGGVGTQLEITVVPE
ncbi:MAG: proprotein convertase P-domain-containing protein, partial [Chloroflexi bacterium]|nr:proprotein convertase P-domain-containing protein [Chloroflexota bacterium]